VELLEKAGFLRDVIERAEIYVVKHGREREIETNERATGIIT